MKLWTQFVYYKELNEPIIFPDFQVIGYFPYETAGIYTTDPFGDATPPRSLFAQLEHELSKYRIADNKYVIICKQTGSAGASHFAIFFKDDYCRIGNWSHVKGYGGKKLELKPKTDVKPIGPSEQFFGSPHFKKHP